MIPLFTLDPDLPNRLAFADLLNLRGLTGVAVEVGVWRGDFSDPFLSRWRGQRLHLVDPWAKLTDYDDVRNRDFDPADYGFVRERMRHYGSRCRLLRRLSSEAVKRFPDSSLDFVYIDANHAYRYVCEDLRLWWPKVRPGGLLAGHDLFSMRHPEVTAALAEFAGALRLTVRAVPGDFNEHREQINEPSWYIERGPL